MDEETSAVEADLTHPQELALAALDGAEWHARRTSADLKPRVLEHVWASAALVYAMLEVAKQVGRVADALLKRKR